MVGPLTCILVDALDAIPLEDLSRLYRDLPDSPEMIPLLEQSGFDGFSFHSIAVRQAGKPIFHLPLFEAPFNLSTFATGWMKKLMNAAAPFARSLLRPRVLGIGFVEGEWGAVGWDPGVDLKTLDKAWDLALETLEALASRIHADVVAFINFNSRGGRIIPLKKLKGYTAVTGLPSAQLPISDKSLDDYLRRLSRNTRKNLRRKLRKAREVQITRSRDPQPWLEEIYRLYLKTARRSPVSFGVHRPAYFSEICRFIPRGEYVLYWVEGKLIAFNLLIVKPDCLVDKYFCMDFALGRKYHLYFVSWIENIRFCIQNRIPLYHVGQTAEKTKAGLGVKFLPSSILFKHRNPILHRLLTRFRHALAYEPEIPLPQARLGLDWEGDIPPLVSHLEPASIR